jgi:hypothetical protein
MVGILVGALLSTAVIAQSAYIVKTRRQMDALYDQVQQLAAESTEGEPTPTPAADRERGFRGSPQGRPAPGGGVRMAPPRFAPAPRTATVAATPPPAGALPLPPAIDSAEARDQLRNFVAAELQRERDEQRERGRQRWEEDQQRRVEAVVKALGLNADDGRKLTDVMTANQTARRELREKVQSGQIARTDIGREMTALREKSDQQLRQVLGDDKMQKFQELQRQDRGGFGGRGRGGPPGGGPPGAGGPQAGGPPPGQGGP